MDKGGRMGKRRGGKKKRKRERNGKKITALRVPRLSPTLVLSKPEEA